MAELETLFKLIRRFEGCRLTPYICPAGVWTAGWGSTGPDVFPGKPWTQEYADYRLELDAVRFSNGTRVMCPGLDGDRLCAIADFAYNLGLGALRGSTLRRRLNAEDWDAARQELRRWVRGGGRKLPGLVLRREAEAALL